MSAIKYCYIIIVGILSFTCTNVAKADCASRKLLLDSTEEWNFQQPFIWGSSLRPINSKGIPLEIGAKTTVIWQEVPYLEMSFYFSDEFGEVGPEVNIGSVEIIFGEGEGESIYHFGECNFPLASFSHGEPAKFHPIKIEAADYESAAKPVRIRIWSY